MFRSFFMAGFECATGQNQHRQEFDQVVATGHESRLSGDFDLVRGAGIRVVREGVRWNLVDRDGGFDFRSLDRIARSASERGLQVIYDLFHYGYPDNLDLFSHGFVSRFSDYCGATADFLRGRAQGPFFFTPINEPSYFSWAAGDAGLFRPHESERSFELKVQLARAAISGINAILKVLPDARFVNVDPLCRVAQPLQRPELKDDVRHFNECVVFESWDMLAGRLLPELGGTPRHLDILGLNYYWTNQWEHLSPGQALAPEDERIWPLRDLIRWVWHRYGQEMVVSETAHCDDLRPGWIRHVADEAEAVLNEGIPLRGVCLYPVLGMPEWHEPERWTRMGLWDVDERDGDLLRIPHEASLRELALAQKRLEGLEVRAEELRPSPFLL